MSAPGRIRLLVLDVDGVITDGTVVLHESGDEVRTIHFHDLDAVARVARGGVTVAILSGEDTAASRRVARRFGVDHAVFGVKDKGTALEALTAGLGVPLGETCYVGDADRDAPALSVAGLGLAPADATPVARAAADHVLAARGGRGAVAEAVGMLERTRPRTTTSTGGASPVNPLHRHLDALRTAFDALDTLDEPLQAAAGAVAASFRDGGKLLAAGNGGSAAEAQHLTGELIGRLHSGRERDALPGIALHADTSALTAVGNDYGYEQVFARQVAAIGRPGDVLVVLSTSGASRNLVEAVDVANERGLVTVGLLGPPTRPLHERCHHLLAVPADDVQTIQTCHLVLVHTLVELVEDALAAAQG